MDRRNFFNWLGVGIAAAPAVVKAVIETRPKAGPIFINGCSLGGINTEQLQLHISRAYLDAIARTDPFGEIFSNDQFR